MYQQFHLLNSLKAELQNEQYLLQQMRDIQKQLPKGYLAYKHDHFYRGVRYQGKWRQIPILDQLPENKQLITQLQTNRYLSKAVPILEKNCLCLKKMLSQFQLYNPVKVRASLSAHYQDFDFSPFLLPGDINPEKWLQAHYRKNSKYPQELKHFSKGGLPMRSKAEADIATMLEEFQLAFRYEPLIQVGQYEYAPDFCIVHPTHRLLILWEHFGMIDQPDYACKTIQKLNSYAENGYHLGLNLIMTYETKKHPLHFGHIQDCIKKYFLQPL